jgi:hypothetical protein
LAFADPIADAATLGAGNAMSEPTATVVPSETSMNAPAGSADSGDDTRTAPSVSSDPAMPNDRDTEIALGIKRRFGLVLHPEIGERAKRVIRVLTGDAFGSDQIDAIFDQVVANLPDDDADKFQYINPDSNPIVLSREQFRIVSEQLNALSPEFRATAAAALQKALDEGRIRIAPD